MRIGTRGSELALWQARHVAARLGALGVGADLAVLSTRGDRVLDVPLAEIGGKGLFTAELDAGLLDGTLDLAVHSLKDLPTTLPEGLALAAVTSREDPSDAFVAHPSFGGLAADLPEGATLATSSLRRQAQLLAWRPDLKVVPVRGNVPTRLRHLDGSAWHGAILATAGLVRLGLADRVRERLDDGWMLPAVGQGALGIVCRADREDVMDALRPLDEPGTRAATTAERALLRALEGGCQVPVAGHARVQDGRLTLDGAVTALEGTAQVRGQIEGSAAAAEALGLALAEKLRARGAGDILAAIRAVS